MGKRINGKTEEKAFFPPFGSVLFHLHSSLFGSPFTLSPSPRFALSSSRFFSSASSCLTLLLIIATPLLFSGLESPAFMDHEGRYAEVAREMLLISDWVTPHLNFTVFLNKPPLPFWLTALTFKLVGLNEYARGWVVICGLGTLTVTFFLGHLLAGARGGLLAGLILLLSGGFFLESRLLRPDMLLTFCISLTVLAWSKAVNAATNPTRERWLHIAALSAALSVMAKGFVGMVLLGGMIIFSHLACRQLSFFREIRWWPLTTIVFLVILPWHLLAGWQNNGFWWDYVVNQHLLFFFDQKFPRDSLPDSLVVFWGAFLGRTFPWSVFLPLAVHQTMQEFRRTPQVPTILPLAWLTTILVFFSLTPSRLEHYSVPALPAVALLVGRWWANIAHGTTAAGYGTRLSCGLLLLGGLAGLVFAPSALATTAWMQKFPLLQQLALLVSSVIVGSSSLASLTLWQHRPQWAFAALALPMALQCLFIYRALVAIEPLNSWKPIGQCIAQLLPADGDVIFAASDEYQICGGLNFYSGKQLSILLPDGYIPATYLKPDSHSRFITREEALRRWHAPRPTFLVIDPERADSDTLRTTLFPGSQLGDWNGRLLLANQNFAEKRVARYDTACSLQVLFNRQR
ncbi:MAG: ArnT family glycosyltransferase [Candidatus Binatia bacterium]